MADYDGGIDLVGEMRELVLSELESRWNPDEAQRRGNEFNCSNVENMAYALAHQGLLSGYVPRKFLPFMKSVLQELEAGIDDYDREDHHWRIEAMRHARMLRTTLERFTPRAK